MDSFIEGTSPEAYISTDELAEELEYQKVLLVSLSIVDNREEAEATIRAEISRLENQIRTLTQGTERSTSMSVAYDNYAVPYCDDPFAPIPTNGERGKTCSSFPRCYRPRLAYILNGHHER
jgi:hypothetical protein